MVLCAILCGADSWVAVATFAQAKLPWSQWLLLPILDTISRTQDIHDIGRAGVCIIPGARRAQRCKPEGAFVGAPTEIGCRLSHKQHIRVKRQWAGLG